uniref:Uncharacterized protein n=1 Tax=Amphimedon queenslandica TaxID=400682 RepID=A0A1X7UDE8_AMPQE
ILTHRLLFLLKSLAERGEYGEMVACDNSSCTVEWFYMDCVKLDKASKGK